MLSRNKEVELENDRSRSRISRSVWRVMSKLQRGSIWVPFPKTETMDPPLPFQARVEAGLPTKRPSLNSGNHER